MYRKGKHIFIEKPIALNVDEAREIVNFSKEKKIVGQVGHVERFNPAFNSVKKIIENQCSLNHTDFLNLIQGEQMFR